MLTNITDIDQVTEAVYVLGASFMGSAKYLALIQYRSALQTFIKDIQQISTTDKSEEQMQFHVAAERKSQFINRIYLKLMFFSAGVLLATPAVVLLLQYVRGTLNTDNLPLPFSFIHNFDVDTTKLSGYLLIYAGCIVFVSSVPAVLMTIDLLFLNSCIHIVANCLDMKHVMGQIDVILEVGNGRAEQARERWSGASKCLRRAVHLHYGTLQ